MNNNAKIMVGEVQHNTKLNEFTVIKMSHAHRYT